MNGTDAIYGALKGTQHYLTFVLADLSDADLLVRPVPGANHIAWQLGHLILSEAGLAECDPAFSYPPVPAGFVEQHAKETAMVEPPKGFATKEAYLKLFNDIRTATMAAVKKMTPEALDKATEGSMAAWAPTLGALLQLTSDHTLMHAGQFSVVRRKLGKPVLF
jgi:hypothetical protein